MSTIEDGGLTINVSMTDKGDKGDPGDPALDGRITAVEQNITSHLAESANKAHGGFKGVLLNKSSAQSISNGVFNPLTWNTEVYDDLNFFDSDISTTQIKIPSGITKAILKAGLSIVATGTGSRSLEIVNDTIATTVARCVIPATTHIGYAYLLAISPCINVVAGNVYTCRVYQNSGGAIDAKTGVSTFFALEVVE